MFFLVWCSFLLKWYFQCSLSPSDPNISETSYNAPSIPMCEYWFQWFKDDNFDLHNKEDLSQPKKFADTEVEALLDAYQCQMLNSHLKTFKVYGSHLKARKLGTICETKTSKDIFAHVNCCFNSKQGKFFCTVSSLGMQNG